MLAGTSNFTISGNARLYDIHGNAVINHLPDTDQRKLKIQSIVNLPRAQASQKDYEIRKKGGPCFPGTRSALLREMADWVTDPGETRMYVLSGLAGIGKSTIVYTLATQADEIGLLGASFFFSREDADRNNAKKFFSTIAHQLCVYDEAFSNAIGDVLLTERGSATTTQHPLEQLKILIMEPLHSVIQSHVDRPILVIVDALDECDEDEEHDVVIGLTQLVRSLPSFKVILTTRPQPVVNYLFSNRDGHTIFHLQDIEDKIVDNDIRLYLSHSFSREQVRARLRNNNIEWCASDENIESLVKAAGRLFIIASTSVFYVLNKTLGNPGTRMKKLLSEIAQDRMPLHDLNHFYSVIVRSAIRLDDGNDDTVDRYQVIVGTIVVIQIPLPVKTLACLIDEEIENIYGILRNLESVILLGSDDTPHIYHKSFSDYLTDPTRCVDRYLRIDSRIRHTQTAIRCFKIMCEHLKYNILGLSDPARFMTNEDGFKEDGVTDKQLQEKIPQQLRYACIYWVNHLAVANIEDVDLMIGLKKFVYEHMLHWFEVLSLIEKLDSAYRAIRVVIKHLKSTSSDLHQLLSDALRFISKFYELIKTSALHTYHSALPFTPTDSLLYLRYIQEAEHCICRIENGPKTWDALVVELSHEFVNMVKFSLDSALLVSGTDKMLPWNYMQRTRTLKVCDATTGTPISMISGRRLAASNDLSTLASSEDKTVLLYDTNGRARGTRFTTLSTITNLALSSESSRVAAGLSDGTVWLWDSRSAELIANFDGFEGSNRYIEFPPQLQFSPTGTRLLYSSANGIVKMRNVISGKFVADLQCGITYNFVFSGDGSRIGSLSYDCGLSLWNSENGVLIDNTWNDRGIRFIWNDHVLAISASGSLLAITDHDRVELWSENRNSLVQFGVIQLKSPASVVFSPDNILAIGVPGGVKLYDVKMQSFISMFPFHGLPKVLNFSLDGTRLAIGAGQRVYLCDVPSIDAPSKELIPVTVLALSRDCSQLACGFKDGAVELWLTSPTKRRIASHQAHMGLVRMLEFCPDGRLFASVSDDMTIKLWNGEGESLRGTLNVTGMLQSLALSNSVLIAGWDGVVAVWSLDTLSAIYSLELVGTPYAIIITESNALIAINADHIYPHHSGAYLFDLMNHAILARFKDISTWETIHTMSILPDNSQLVMRSSHGVFRSLNLINGHITKGPILEHLIQLPNIPLWRDVPVWYRQDEGQMCLSALFSQYKRPVPVLWVPKYLSVSVCSQGSSMIALGCNDGRIILLRPPISHIG